ncbi:MAG TPA: D-alanyl-D-alanine dipeptidase [Stellaceae bacterium]|nr:D-alanyl-D-alanine dipeptidase [Stellaceae bacterium]
MSLIEIRAESHAVRLDIAYASGQNVTGKPIYARPGCYLHADAAARLQRAVELARPLGLALKIFDAFRPSEAQWKLWEFRPDPEFVADPRTGSPHSRGVAVDLTLVDAASGVELDMGTGFDAFTPLSHHGSAGVSLAAQRNRLLLLGLMTAAGWDHYAMEWWHYQLFDAGLYPLLVDADLAVSMMQG